MEGRHWARALAKAPRLVASTAAPIAMVAFLAGAYGCERRPRFVPVASVKEIMVEVLEPAADGYWDAVGSVSDKSGITEHAPRSEAEWTTVRNNATVIAESGNLLLMDPRARDAGDWATFSRELVAVGVRARAAAEARDAVRVFDVGAELYEACTNCHARYVVSPARPGK